MEITILARPKTASTYPGEHTHIPAQDLLFELQLQHEGKVNPLMNIEENTDAFIIKMAVPGLKCSDFNVSIEGCLLTISFLHGGEENDKKIFRQPNFNIRYFKKEIVVPENIDNYFITALYKVGILYVFLPKSVKPFTDRSDHIVVY